MARTKRRRPPKKRPTPRARQVKQLVAQPTDDCSGSLTALELSNARWSGLFWGLWLAVSRRLGPPALVAAFKSYGLADAQGQFTPGLLDAVPPPEILDLIERWRQDACFPPLRGRTRVRRTPLELQQLVRHYSAAYWHLKDLPKDASDRYLMLVKRMPSVFTVSRLWSMADVAERLSRPILQRLVRDLRSNRQLTLHVVAYLEGIEPRTLARELNRGWKLFPKSVVCVMRRQGSQMLQVP